MFAIFSYKWYLDTFVFHKGVHSTSADTSSPLVPTRCLLFLVTNGCLTLFELFFVKKIRLSRRVGYVMDGSIGQYVRNVLVAILWLHYTITKH